jgi:transcriptional regulator with XRE-family HTH domain
VDFITSGGGSVKAMRLEDVISERIKIMMRDRNLKAVQVVRKIDGMSAPKFSHYLSGRWKPRVHTLIALADIFGCTVDYLVGRTSNE